MRCRAEFVRSTCHCVDPRYAKFSSALPVCDMRDDAVCECRARRRQRRRAVETCFSAAPSPPLSCACPPPCRATEYTLNAQTTTTVEDDERAHLTLVFSAYTSSWRELPAHSLGELLGAVAVQTLVWMGIPFVLYVALTTYEQKKEKTEARLNNVR